MSLTIESLIDYIAAVGALGTASYGLVDATKAGPKGGISRVGFRFIQRALQPFENALMQIDDTAPYAAIQANWINAVPKADQKLATRNLIRLGLTEANATTMAAKMPSIDSHGFAAAVAAVRGGQPLTDVQLDLLGRFDAIIDSRLDAAYERADQRYRNIARLSAGFTAVVLALAGQATLMATGNLSFNTGSFMQAFLVGLVAVPMAPVAKDLTSALTTAISAFKASKS